MEDAVERFADTLVTTFVGYQAFVDLFFDVDFLRGYSWSLDYLRTLLATGFGTSPEVFPIRPVCFCTLTHFLLGWYFVFLFIEER